MHTSVFALLLFSTSFQQLRVPGELRGNRILSEIQGWKLAEWKVSDTKLFRAADCLILFSRVAKCRTLLFEG